MTERRLHWEGCLNVRDLGGHPTEDGGETRMGAVVRADSVRKLTPEGWDALVAYGIRTIVDLRQTWELDEDPPEEVPVGLVHISFFPDISFEEQMEHGARWLEAPDEVSAVRAAYLGLLELAADRIAAAVSAIATAPAGGVLVHCAGGKDRTGMLAAILLRLAGVSIADIAADYGLSAEYLKPVADAWVEEAGDDTEAALRRRLSASPADAMVQVLEALEREHGSVRGYLLGAGADQAELEVVRSRMLS